MSGVSFGVCVVHIFGFSVICLVVLLLFSCIDVLLVCFCGCVSVWPGCLFIDLSTALSITFGGLGSSSRSVMDGTCGSGLISILVMDASSPKHINSLRHIKNTPTYQVATTTAATTWIETTITTPSRVNVDVGFASLNHIDLMTIKAVLKLV